MISPETTVDQLCVNAIRALAIDTVLKANSGHPGLPLGAAPVGYSLFARLDEAQPREPRLARPRPVRALGRPRLGAPLQPPPPHGLRPPARRAEAVPPVGEPHPRPPGVRRHAGRRDDDRAARPGLRDERRDGDGRGSPRRAVQPAGARGGRPPHVRPRRGRRPHGGRRARGGVARRAPRAREARRLLRLQPHLPGRLHEPVLHRRRRAGVRGLRLARREGGRRERPRGPRARDRHREGGDRPALPRDRAHRDRLRQPEAGHASACTARRSTPSR